MRRSAAITGMRKIHSLNVQAGRRQIQTPRGTQHSTANSGRAKLATGRPMRLSQNTGSNVTATPVTGARNRALSGCAFGSAIAISDQPSQVQKKTKRKHGAG